MAGKSTRFPSLRPKWMLTHPMTGDLMCIESIKGLNLQFFDKIYFTILKEHEVIYNISIGLKKCFEKLNISDKTNIVILDENTTSQSETVYLTLKKENVNGFIFIKDSDNFFSYSIEETKNQICFFDLNKVDINIDAKSKSYIQMNTEQIITNIVEKRVISSNFSVGGYSFESSEIFCKYFENISSIEGECFLSNIIFEMIMNNQIFRGKEVSNFIDWGTLQDWKNYCEKFSTIFVDLDGTLITNTSNLIPPFLGDGVPLEKNIELLNKIHERGFCKIIITTSRSEEIREQTIEELKKCRIRYDFLIMGLPHAQRILINDFANSNPYPSAKCINLPRNADELKNYLSL